MRKGTHSSLQTRDSKSHRPLASRPIPRLRAAQNRTLAEGREAEALHKNELLDGLDCHCRLPPPASRSG